MWSNEAREAAAAARSKEGQMIRDHFNANARMFGGASFARSGGGQAVADNNAAARALAGSTKSTMVPIHEAMAGNMNAPTSARSPADFDRVATKMLGPGFAARRGLK